MTRILICDDEGIVQESLKFMITKSFGDECELESAKNGRTAIERAETFRPDIILMDVQMPGINGIDAMREIRKENKNVVFIVLTAYDKFEYTQRAIDIGVTAYLTKPISKDTLTETIRNAMKKVGERKAKVSHDLEVREKLEAVVPVIEGGFIYSILLEGMGEEHLRYRELLDIKEEYAYVMVIECGDEIHKGVLSNTVGAGIKLQKHYMMFRETIKESTGGIVGNLMANKVIVVIPCEDNEEAYETRIKKIDSVRSLLRNLEQQLELKFKAGIGLVESWSNMAESYREAMETVRQGIGKVAHAKDLSVTCQYEESYPRDLEKELFEAVSKGNTEKTHRVALQFVLWMEKYSAKLNNLVRLKAIEFVLWGERLAYLQGGMLYRFKDREGYLDMVNGITSYEELGSWFSGKLVAASRHISMQQQEKADNVVERAKAYIRDNFSRELSLEEMAKEVGISPYYLSKLFKESEGINYIEYVTKLRMDYAKKELLTKEKSIKEICSDAGYGDPNYFSRIFKKWTGVTPTEYKDGGAL